MTRKFNLVDMMILVAATALGIAAVQSYLATTQAPGPVNTEESVRRGFWAFSKFALVLTLAWLVVGLRKPRPPLRRLSRQPGWVACVAVALALGSFVIEFALVKIRFYLTSPPGWTSGYHLEHFLRDIASYHPDRASFAVLVVWSVVALGGGWSRRRGWIDAFGRVLGLYWLAYPFLKYVLLM